MARPRAQDYDTKRSTIFNKSAELIAEAYKVSKALIFHYYPDRKAVLFDVIRIHLAERIAMERRLVSLLSDAVSEALPQAEAIP